jgi:hypothetical protein
VINTSTHSEHVQVIRCDFKPGSVERSIDLDEEGIPQEEEECYFNSRKPIKIEYMMFKSRISLRKYGALRKSLFILIEQ